MTGVVCAGDAECGVVLLHETASKHALNGMMFAFFIHPLAGDIGNLFFKGSILTLQLLFFLPENLRPPCARR